MNYVIITIIGAIVAWVYSLLRRIDTLQDESSKNKYDSDFKGLTDLLNKAKNKVKESERDYADAKKTYTDSKSDSDDNK